MKRMIICLILCIFVLCGCSNRSNDANGGEIVEIYDVGYDNGYNAGYDDGYDVGYDAGYYDGLNEKNYEEEYLEFQSTIVTLMYDYEYETVEKLFEYYPEAVGHSLEQEFGTENIPAIIDYLESDRKVYPDTIVGKCRYCGEDVYYKDAVHIVSLQEPYEISYAHQNCSDENK